MVIKLHPCLASNSAPVWPIAYHGWIVKPFENGAIVQSYKECTTLSYIHEVFLIHAEFEYFWEVSKV